ncbi:MAG TPA: 50S ribosomal protein L18 [Candidatus Altiarchaeales archaeon]|nr:50S ribosomal protein L18 [Candidatus Altiarchaeales archaeon]
MAKSSRHVVPYRRRREGKTNYRKRLNLLKSKKLRVVVRKTNKHMIAQLIKYHEDGDRVLVSAHSSELKKFGWEFATGNIPAAYLTGYLLGVRSLKKNFKEGILDIGLHPPVKKSRVFAALKGLIDAGMEIPHDAVVFPEEERILGKDIKSNGKDAAKIIEKVKEEIREKCLQ